MAKVKFSDGVRYSDQNGENEAREENGRTNSNYNEELDETSSQKQRTKMKMKTPYVLAGLIVVLLLVGVWSVMGQNSAFPAVPAGKWQAVFLNNNQVYFGHLRPVGNQVMLTDIFYLQAVQPLQQGAQNPPPQLQLVKLGNELHGPTDQMYIPQANILFWETMKDDSQVTKAITDYLSANK